MVRGHLHQHIPQQHGGVQLIHAESSGQGVGDGGGKAAVLPKVVTAVHVLCLVQGRIVLGKDAQPGQVGFGGSIPVVGMAAGHGKQ